MSAAQLAPGSDAISGIGLADGRRVALRRKRPSLALRTAILVSIGLHAAAGYYLWKNHFEPRYRTYGPDEVTDVTLIPPAPPPPPPAPPPKLEPPKLRPPPRVQPRPPKHAAPPAALAPLPIAPTPRRIELPSIPPRLITRPARLPVSPVPAPPAPPVITQPDWLTKPSAADFARYYPDRAQRRGTEGRATIRCRVDVAGRLNACRTLAETPAGAGFGEAAIRMSRNFKMKPMSRDGHAVAGGVVQIPIRFQLPD